MRGFRGLPLRPFDYAVLLFSIGISLFTALYVYAGPDDRHSVRIEGRNARWIFPLEAEERVRVPGPLGITELELHGGLVRVLSSPCANQTCVAAKPIGRRGQWTACLPNGVFILIEGNEGDGDIDAVAW